ncbi:DUF2957 domain-containing protein [Trinickia sp. LjRoot230]|uniref:DUF2957 domain-containing protein n=1 Tax=Trinickia sp. LjRoot230 TaxID=3342288 RepID=UPI003ECCEF14
MPSAITTGLLLTLASAPLLVACGGSNSNGTAAASAPQCSGASCGVQGAPVSTPIAPLCPSASEIAQNTYLGGTGSGEIVSLAIDPNAMTYTLKWLESPIPLTTGQVTPTRAGTTITGQVTHRADLPSAEQNRCAFVLQPGSGTASNGSAYSTNGTFNANNPPTIFIGYGVAGGGIPGAQVQYAGILGLFAVPDRKFDFYPFIGFSAIDTSLADLHGTYNALVYHIQPSDTYQAAGTSATETFDASGNCTASSGSCTTTGGTWAASSSGSYFTSNNPPRIVGGATLGSSSAHANMVLGKFNGAIVPIVVRTGYANPGTLSVDDESGIAMLAAAGTLASGSIDGGYIGADSNFKYTATIISGSAGKFVDPPTSTAESTFTLGYPASNQGLLGVQDSQGNAGYAIATGFSPTTTTGGLYAILLQGTENGGITASSAITGQTTSSTPYFGIGAFVGAR